MTLLQAPEFSAEQQSALSGLRAWLSEHGTFCHDVGDVLAGLCPRLVEAGIPLVRMTSHIRSLHSDRMGVMRVWRPGQPVVEKLFPIDSAVRNQYEDSPIKIVHESRAKLRFNPQSPDAPAYGITPDLKALGITDYILYPLLFSDGVVHAYSVSTDHPDGFAPAHIALIEALHSALLPILELRTTYRIFREVLEIYVGRGPAERILGGDIHRGQVSKIEAAILFCDLRGFTELSTELPAEELALILNRYFDCVVPAVRAHGGEILKFIGDEVLAIFPTLMNGKQTGKCTVTTSKAALNAARDGLKALEQLNEEQKRLGEPPLRFGVSLHHGTVAYGNVGAYERQDFTVVGRDVNLAARVATLCADLNAPILLSDDFARLTDEAIDAVGSFQLKGLKGWHTVHSLLPYAKALNGAK